MTAPSRLLMLRTHFGLSVRPFRPRNRPFRALQAATGSHFTCHRRPRRTTPPPSPPPSRHPRRRPCYRRPRALTSCSSHRTVSKEAWDSTTKEQKVKYIDSLLANARIAKQMNELIKQSYGQMKKKIVTPVVFEHLPVTKNKKFFDECLVLLTAGEYAQVGAKVSLPPCLHTRPPRASPALPPSHCIPLRRPAGRHRPGRRPPRRLPLAACLPPTLAPSPATACCPNRRPCLTAPAAQGPQHPPGLGCCQGKRGGRFDAP